MMRIAIGFKYVEPAVERDFLATLPERTKEVVLIGNGDRCHLDRLVVRAPEEHRAALQEFFAPLLEGKMPATHGSYHPIIMWWKRVEVLP